MPLLNPDNSRGGGGPSDEAPRPCRTIAELLGIETMLSEPVGVPGASGNEHREWSWEPPGSPEAAQTPRALVPPACFPTHHPMAFASFSESAQPGEPWNGHVAGPHANHSAQSIKAWNGHAARPHASHSAQPIEAWNGHVTGPHANHSPQPIEAWNGHAAGLHANHSALPMEAWNGHVTGPHANLRAQPVKTWNGHAVGPHANHNGTDQGMHDIVTSLKAMTMCSAGAAGGPAFEPSPQPQTAMDDPEYWSAESYSNVQLRDESSRGDLSRRASFSGESGRNGCSVVRWTGQLPPRAEEPEGGFSARVFLGGLPWDVSDASLAHSLRHIGLLHMDWPGWETGPPRGYAYVTLESERRVRALLAACRRENGCWYYRLPSRKMRPKEVQVIPWAVSDANWAAAGAARLEATRTVFVGALHGMLSARALARVMNDLFAGVVYAGIDTDKNKYPIGSGRVTFDNVRSYLRAVSAAYIEIQTDKFTKKVQIDPYLEDSMCSVCNLQQGPYFCRQPTCFGYFCRSCWSWKHSKDGLESHTYLMRNSKGSGTASRAASRAPTAPSARPDHALYNGHCPTQKDSTPSPATSATSSELEAAGDDPELWASR